MKKNWPYFIVASLLNTLLVTGAFIEFKLQGLAGIVQQPGVSGIPVWNDIDPFQFATGMFVLSFLVIVAIIGIKELVTRIISFKLQATSFTLQAESEKGKELVSY